MNWLSKILFSAFLDADEKIVYVAHRHIFIHMKTLFKVFVLGIIVPICFQLLLPEQMMIWLGWAGLGALVFLYKLFDWYYDVWIFTNIGVVNVEWNGFLDRSATRVDYHMIEGISYSVKGFWQTIFNYGDIILERIGAANPITLKDAAKPRKVEQKFTHFHVHYMDRRRFSNHESLKDLLSEMLHEHAKGKGIFKDK